MKKYTDSGSKDTRSGFGAGLEELGKTNENVVALCADLTGSLKMNAFADQNPDRFYQVGIAEANMMGIAAGLTIGGKIPVHWNLCKLLYGSRVRSNPSEHRLQR
jgi:transketolase